jgi:hypothetical protein
MKKFEIGLFMFVTLLLASVAYGQVSTGDILGTVTDQSGAVAVGAYVKAVNLGTRETRTETTGDNGEFVFTALQSGHYSISVTAKGFKGFFVPDLTLSAGDRARVAAKLEVGQASETVQVNANVEPALQTDSSTVSTMATVEQLQDLPLNGRNYINIAQTAAGANEGPPASLAGGSRPDDRRQTSAISVNGQSDSNNDELIDGIDNNERVIGTTGVRPSVDAIAEFRVQTSTYPAEIGRTAGGVVNIISKSGSNGFHGSAYEFLRNNDLDGRNFFATTGASPEYRQNQFGASISDPIIKNRTFFFGDYEGLRIIQGQTYTSTVPTLYEEQNVGDFTDIGGSVLTTLNPIAVKYFALYPAPTSTATVNNFTYSPNKTQFSNVFDVRIDHRFNDNNTFFGRFSYNNVKTFTPGALPSVGGVGVVGNASLYSGNNKEGAQNIILNYTHLFSPTLLAEFKVGYTRINILGTSLNYGKDISDNFGLANVNVSTETSGLATMNVIGYATLGDGNALPLNYLDNTFQYSGALTKTWKTHTIKVGASLVRRQVVSEQQLYGDGYFYSVGLDGFLSGAVYQVLRWNELYRPEFRTWEPTVYAQDDWRVTKNLTVNMGLRYDAYTPFTEAHNRLSNFDPSLPGYLLAGQSGVSDSAGVKADWKDISPRVGFAYTVRHGTVVRGGYGMTYFPDDSGFPFYLLNTPYASIYLPNANSTTLSTPLPVPTAGDPTVLTGGCYGVNTTKRKTAYIHQFNFNVQQDFKRNVVTVGYVGGIGHRLQESPNVNLAPPSTSTTESIQSRRPYYSEMPDVTSIINIQNFGYSSYNSLQAQVERRMSRGLVLNANYTFAHALTDVVTYANAGGGLEGVGAVPSRISTLDYGNSDLDIRHRITTQIGYDLPFGSGLHGAKGILEKGWQVNALNVWSTGQPFTIVNATGQSNTGVTTDGDRPNQVSSPKIAHPSISEFFNTAAFEAQTFGTIGNVAKNSLYGPHFRHLDASVFKTFDLINGTQLQFRAEFFNVMNTPNFANPDGALGDATFGTISSTQGNSNPRQIQFALKLTF